MAESRSNRTSIGPFDLLEVIGRGATATVYKARHRPTGKIAAVKVGSNSVGLDANALERFRREFTVIRRMRHPNLVRPLAFGVEGEGPFVVLEYMAGQSLEERIKVSGALAFRQATHIFLQVAEALRYLHSNQVLHRDIKPSNVLIDGQERAKLADFGLLKSLTDQIHLTRSRQGMGTMEFGAPEQFDNAKHVDCRCDLYSLVATFYTALTGKFPFGNGGQLQLLQRKFLKQWVPLRLFLPEIDPAIDQLVNRCLDPKPDMRPRDCDEFIEALREWDRRLAAAKNTDPPTLKPAAAERRAALRSTVELKATFVPFHQHIRGRWEATILDLSSRGVRLRTSRAVAVHAALLLTFPKRAMAELAVVRWVQAAKNQSEEQIVGCSFVHPLPRQEVESILGTAPACLAVS
jgi:serine/threonine protein kinase